jgi:hypothetical protein
MRQIRSLERDLGANRLERAAQPPSWPPRADSCWPPPQAVATIGLVIARRPTTVCAIGKIAAGYPCFRHDDTRD